MLTFNYGSPYFWDKVVLTKFINGCRMVWDLICGTSWFYNLKTEKITGGRKSVILPNWCCLLSITALFTHLWSVLSLHIINLIAADSIKRPPPMQKSNGIHNLPVLHIPEYTPTQSFGGSVHKQRTKKAQIPMPPFTARTSNSSGGHPGKETII